MSYLLTESTITMIQSYAKANITAALADVRTDRPGGLVQTPIPRSYFLYQKAHGYQLPAIFIICPSFEYRLNKGQNHVNALVRVNIQVENEDRVRDLLTIKNWRYQAALTKMFDGTHIDSSDKRVRLVTKLLRNTFSDLYYRGSNNPEDPDTTFIQGVVLELEVEHYEDM